MTTPAAGIRVVVYDVHDRFRRGRPGLSPAWAVGARLYRGLGHVTHALPASSLEQLFSWFARLSPTTTIEEVQWWSHGKWGNAMIGKERLDAKALTRGSALAGGVDALAARLSPTSLFWLRTCESFGARRGLDFARALSTRLACRVAGHTHVIGPWQSGLHSLTPGAEPTWSAAEGLIAGTPTSPRRAAVSLPGLPNTIFCMQSTIPDGW
ncbi:MAG: hypothetical protein R3B13_32060 [Polyangiaceae bacterium]